MDNKLTLPSNILEINNGNNKEESKSFYGKETKCYSKKMNKATKNNCFKISKPKLEVVNNYEDKKIAKSPTQIISQDAYFSITSCDFSTHKKSNDQSILNLKLKESPNYQSIMDLWRDQQTYTTILSQPNQHFTSSYFTRQCDDQEMENTDEGIRADERTIPQIRMINLVQAVRSNKISEELNLLLQSSKRFKITEVNSQLKKGKQIDLSPIAKEEHKEKTPDHCDSSQELYATSHFPTKFQNKTLVQESELDHTHLDLDNSAIFKEETQIIIKKNCKDNSKTNIPASSGIIKNTIPVFKAKLMNKNPINKPTPIIEIKITGPDEDSQEENKDETLTIDDLVSKANFRSSTQILKKDYIDNKLEKDTIEGEMVYSEDESYLLPQRQSTNLLTEDYENEIHKLHMLQSLQALQYLKTIKPPPISELKDKLVFLPEKKSKKKTLIFDMDETLIHCVDSIQDENPQYVIKVILEEEEVQAGINIRPYALECLEAVNQKFEVIVFTASHQTYADAVLDFLDPQKELIKKRLYRDSCYETEEGVYIKDLRIFANRNLKDLIIVDNAVYSFGFQLNNGIPIIPFYDDQNDEELFHLVPFLEILADSKDIREKNIEAFQLEQMASKNELCDFNRICEISETFAGERFEDDLNESQTDGYLNID
ncbi:unnamed protein product [Moneuplotes crassus]|uniref:FCP1 homology domain-containing protein n=1 Tax=Euplotes crassus TaxID=5936 RepID=A0AAD1X6W2_EUPCR|nr:unnamed protein product [Moneuplotes crassus]